MNAVRWLVVCAVSSGCTAAKAQFQILAAAEELHLTEKGGAPSAAPFEHEMAVQYLDKAREKVASGQNGVADALARKSIEWSDRAVAVGQRKRQMDVQVEDFAEQAAPALGQPPPLAPVEPEEEPMFGDEDDEEIEIELGPKPPAPAPKPGSKPAPKPEPRK